MSDRLDVLVICGSLRKASYNAALARTLPELAPAGMAFRSWSGLDAIPLYNFDIQEASGFPPAAEDMAGAIRSADGLVIVSPEYNWSIPGVLKNAIDWVSRMKEGQPFKDKPVAIQSASAGVLGGSRMQYHLRQSLTSVGAVLFGTPEVVIAQAPSKFDAELKLTDETTRKIVTQQLAGFESLIRRWNAK